MLDGMQGKNSGIRTSLVTIHRAKIVQLIAEASAVEVDTREVRIL